MCPASTKCDSKTDFNSSAPVCEASKQVQKNLTCKIKHVQDQTCTIPPSILHLSRVRSHKFSIAAMCNAHNKLSHVFERFCIPQRAFTASWRIRYWLLQKKHIQRKTSSPSTPDFRTQPFTALTKSFSR